jgi:hypothetical protein
MERKSIHGPDVARKSVRITEASHDLARVFAFKERRPICDVVESALRQYKPKVVKERS